MGDGYDYDYLVPRGTLARFLTRMESVWPNWLLEGEGNSLLRRDAFVHELPPSTESGFVLHRDASMRERFHRDGGFVDTDGSSPISVWVVGWDELLMHVDFVLDLRPPAEFLARIQDVLAAAIADHALEVKRSETVTLYGQPMEREWIARNWAEVLALEPTLRAAIERDPALHGLLSLARQRPSTQGAAIVAHEPPSPELMARGILEVPIGTPVEPSLSEFLERSVIRLLGFWHRVAYVARQDDQGHKLQPYTMPPGDLVARAGALEIVGRGRPMIWSPTSRPALFSQRSKQ
jgi:hypothetical protein